MSSEKTDIASPTHRVPSAGALEHGYPHGHLGHLTAQEEEAFRNFKNLITEKGDYNPGPPPSHDDPTLLRFLRARKWVVQDAYKQFKDTEDWRAANHLNVLYDTIDLTSYEEARTLYPQWTGRRDRRGIPLYVFEIKNLDSKTIAQYEKSSEKTYSKAKVDGKTPAKLLRLFALYENLTRFTQPLATELTDRDNADTPITLSTNIVDVSGVSLRMFWNLKSHMQAASQLATANYPETLDRIFILGAPMFFSTVWGWIKRWFDPITVSKIFILNSNEALPVLTSFIDPKNIPKKYGGELEFNWKDPPVHDPEWDRAIEWENGFKTFPTGPLYWKPIDDGKRLECLAVGTVEQKERRIRVCTIRKAYPHVPTPAGVTTNTPVTAAATTPATETHAVEAPVTNGDVAEPKQTADDATTQKLQELSLEAKADAKNNDTSELAQRTDLVSPPEEKAL